MRIDLTDNTIGGNNCRTYSRKDISALFPIADKKISDLCRENEKLLIFPDSLREAYDKIGDETLLSISTTDDPERVYICTGNIMGFIGIGNLKIKIKSRFDEGRDDYFLHYMLQKVLSFSLFDLNHDNEREDIFDFVMFMFPYFLKNALRQGIYREYRTIRHNDSDVKGSIDLNRHLRLDTPFMGKVAYSTREYVPDNNMTELIRHTIEFMKTKKYGNAVLDIDRETIDNVNSIIRYTPSYNKQERSNIISKNLRQKSHPYYTEYRPLQCLCLQILKMEEIKYGDCDDEICGILFDGAWLWEEYLNTILKKEGYIHPQNRQKKGRIYLFEDKSGIRYPDFYKDDIVLDAKYKRLGSYDKVSNIDRNDLHQLITYLAVLKASNGGFVAPISERQTNIPSALLNGIGSTLFIFGMEICKTATSYKDFCRKMNETEMRFIKSINDCFSRQILLSQTPVSIL